MTQKVALLLVALVQGAAPLFLYFNGFDAATGGPTPIVPAGYAFSIWGVIYALSLAFAAAQFLPAADAHVFHRLFLPSLLLFALSSVWLGFARFGPVVGTVPTIAAMLVLAIIALIRASDSTAPIAPHARWIVLPLFGLYAGWLTVATFANITEVMKAAGVGFFGLTPASWTIGALTLATLLACGVALRAGGAWSYGVAIIWALVAIVVANRMRGDPPEIIIACAVGIALVLAATMTAQQGWMRLTPELRGRG